MPSIIKYLEVRSIGPFQHHFTNMMLPLKVSEILTLLGNFRTPYICIYYVDFHETACQDIWGWGPNRVARNFGSKVQKWDFFVEEGKISIFKTSIWRRNGCARLEISFLIWFRSIRGKKPFNCPKLCTFRTLMKKTNFCFTSKHCTFELNVRKC